MNIQPYDSEIDVAVPYGVASARATYLARWVSNVGSPPVLGIAATVLCATTISARTAWLWAGLYTLLSGGLPLLYIIWLYGQGKVSDLHLNRREERIGPLLVTLAATLLGWLLLVIGDGPILLVVLAVATSGQTLNF